MIIKIKSIEHIKKYNPTANLKTKQNLWKCISYNSKLWAFKTEFTMDYKIIHHSWIIFRKVRNDSSHRSPENEEKIYS